MPYGEIRVDTITFTNGGVDKSITVSGLFASTSGNLTVTGTVSGVTATFATGTFSSQVSALTVVGTTGTFTSLTGTTITGANASFVSGVFTNQISGATVTGTTANFTSGNFTSISGGTASLTSGVFASGTATNPSISFTSDPNTGIYSPGADQVALSTNGTGRLFVTSAGNVGINTSAPSQLLHVAGSARVGGDNTTDAELQIGAGATGNRNAYIDLIGDTTYMDYGLRLIRTNGGVNATSQLAHRGTGDLQIITEEAGSLTFSTNLNERARIDSSGRLGLGTSSPFTTLHSTKSITGGSPATSGTTDANVFARFQGGSVGLDIGGTVAGTQWIQPRDVNNFATNYGLSLCPNGGNVGIGTSSPGVNLDVIGAIRSKAADGEGGQITLTNASNTDVFYLDVDSLGQMRLFTDASNKDMQIGQLNGTGCNINFYTSQQERARISSSGNLLVGLSAPVTITSAPSKQQIFSTNEHAFSWLRGSNDSYGVNVHLAKSRNANPASRTILQNGDEVGAFIFVADDGTDLESSVASIACAIDGTPGANDTPGRLVFSTTADGASGPTERMRIKSTGIINIGNTPTYADNTAALAGGLVAGDIYRKSDGTLMIAY